MTARAADVLVCDSQAIGDVWRQRFGRESVFIPYGAADVREAPRDRLDQLGLGSDPYVLVVARLAPENNVDLALDALALLGDAAPPAVVVGNANFQSDTQDRLVGLHAAGKLSWLGHVDDQRLLTQLWAHSACYIHGHSVGGTNPALLQALGAGAPTIALDTPYNREVLRDEAQLFRPDASHLALRMRRLVASDAERQWFRSRGREIVQARYRWDDVCRRYEDLLAGLALNRATARAAVHRPSSRQSSSRYSDAPFSRLKEWPPVARRPRPAAPTRIRASAPHPSPALHRGIG